MAAHFTAFGVGRGFE
nr:hypothetical protein [Vibrio cholerae]